MVCAKEAHTAEDSNVASFLVSRVAPTEISRLSIPPFVIRTAHARVASVPVTLVMAAAGASDTTRVVFSATAAVSESGAAPTVGTAVTGRSTDVPNVVAGASTSTVVPGATATVMPRSIAAPACVLIEPLETVYVTAPSTAIIYPIAANSATFRAVPVASGDATTISTGALRKCYFSDSCCSFYDCACRDRQCFLGVS